jgi:hypothetical protein
MRSFPLLLVAILCPNGAEALAFGLPSRRSSSAARKAPPSSPSGELQDLEVVQKKKAGMTNLRFQASTNYATQPTKLHDDSSSLESFFFCDGIRDMILAGGSENDGNSKNEIELLSTPDVALYHLWQVEASNAPSFESPMVGDSILRVTTHGIHFPGLTIRTRATVGCKKVLVSNDEDDTATPTPQLQITLITDELQAQGPDTLVWVFKQLTGGNNKRSSSSDRRTHSTNTISAETTPEGGVIFRSVARLMIDVSFPSLLLSILPVSKQMAERQGSDAIRKVVERDIGPSLEAVRKLYMNNEDTPTV